VELYNLYNKRSHLYVQMGEVGLAMADTERAIALNQVMAQRVQQPAAAAATLAVAAQPTAQATAQ
jgi:hypothetical protein